MKQKVIVIVVLVVILLIGGYWYFNGKNSANNSNGNNTNSTYSQTNNTSKGDVPGDSGPNPQTPTTDTIAVSTQVPGNSINIDNAYLSEPGFIVIHEATADGKPGNIIASSGLLGVGPIQDLEIKVTVKAGAKYFAMLHKDNGDKKFNVATDAPITANDIPIMTLFSVSQ